MADLPQITPMISYEDPGAAADWLVRAFGFEEALHGDRLYRVEDVEGHRWMFASRLSAA